MPELDLDQELISLSAGARFGDIAQVQADGLVEFRGQAELRRGINLELGVGALATLNAGFSKFIAVDAEIRALAEAQLKGQIQLPIDLFNEAGVVVRLRAIARAAVQGRISIGLAIGDFLALAEQDSRIDGIFFELLTIFLSEIEPKIGVHGIASVAAKAYLNFSITGQLVENETDGIEAGFVIAFGMGAGLKAGFGWGVFAELGVKDSRRLVRRSVDVLVDEGVEQILARISTDAAYERGLVLSMRGPAKIAFRMAFEIGMAVAEKSSFLTNSGSELANRVVAVFMEELQRVLLEELTKVAIAGIQQGLAELGAADDAWEQSEPQRDELSTLLGDMPEDPFDISPANLTYWSSAVNHCVSIAIALGGDNLVGATWAKPVALLWSSVQLLMAAAERVVDANARASFFGAFSAEARIEAFKGQIVHEITAPQVICATVNQGIGQPESNPVEQQHLVEFLLQTGIDELIEQVPELQPILEIVAGPGADAAALASGFSTILNNSGAFVPGPGGSVDAEATLRALGDGFSAYFEFRVEGELQPLLHEVTNDDPTLALYIDDVIIPSMLFASDTIIDRVLDWSFGDISYKDSLREACSSMLMKVFGRSLVVTADVLVDHALQHISSEVHELHDQAGDDDGIAHQLSQMLGTSRGDTTELVEEGLLIAAEVFGPMPEERRAKIRSHLYTLLDPMPTGANDDWVSNLAEDLFIPDEASREALLELSHELGTTLRDLVVRFFGRFLSRVGEIVIEELWELIEAGHEIVEAWLSELQSAIASFANRLLELPGEILAAALLATQKLDDALQNIRDALGVLNASTNQSQLAAGLRTAVKVSVNSELAKNSTYKLLPGFAKDLAKNAAGLTVNTVANDLVLLPILGVLQTGSSLADEILEDVQLELRHLQTIDPNASVGETLNRIFLDRIETEIINLFGGENPKFKFKFGFSYNTFFGPVEVSINLGHVTVPLVELVSAFRSAASTILTAVDTLADASSELIEAFTALDQEAALEIEQANAQTMQPLLQQQLDESLVSNAGIVLVQPTQNTIYDTDVAIELIVQNVSPSFAGLGDLDAERISIYINEEPVNINQFSIEEQGVLLDFSPAPDGIAVGKKQPLNDNPGIKIGHGSQVGKNRPLGWDEKQVSNKRPQQERKIFHKPGDKHAAFSAKSVKNLPKDTSKEPHEISVAIQNKLKQPGLVYRQGKKIATSKFDVNFFNSIETKLLPTQLMEIRGAAGPGIVLKGILPQSQLRAGVNTLTCAIVTGYGDPVATTVVFLVERVEKHLPSIVDAIGLPANFGFNHASKDVAAVAGLQELHIAASPKLLLKGNNAIPGRTEELGFPGRRSLKKGFSAIAREQSQRLKQPALKLKALRTELVAGSLRPRLQDTDSCRTKSSPAKQNTGTNKNAKKRVNKVVKKPIKKTVKPSTKTTTKKTTKKASKELETNK